MLASSSSQLSYLAGHYVTKAVPARLSSSSQFYLCRQASTDIIAVLTEWFPGGVAQAGDQAKMCFYSRQKPVFVSTKIFQNPLEKQNTQTK